jgi:hypothetical protein
MGMGVYRVLGEAVTALFAADAKMERGRGFPFKKRGWAGGLLLKTDATPGNIASHPCDERVSAGG